MINRVIAPPPIPTTFITASLSSAFSLSLP